MCLKPRIQITLYSPSQWTYDILPWILGYLTTWEDIEFSILAESGITTVMKDIIYAPVIPVVSYMQPIRNWAASLLNRWKSHPEAQTLDASEKTRLGLDIDLPADAPAPSTETHSTPNIFYRTGEIARDFQELEDSLAEQNEDHSRIFRALDKIEAWKTETEPLSASCIRDTLSSTMFAHRPLLATAVRERIESAMKPFSMPNHIERRVTSLSYYVPPEHGSSIRLTFRDKNALPDARMNNIFESGPPDNRTWADVSIETDTMGPMQVLFSEFICIANPQHRHPLAPLTNFSFASSPDPFRSTVGRSVEEVRKRADVMWEVSSGRFIQGRVEDLPLTEDNIVYYNRGPFNRLAVHDLTMKQPRERTLPPTCVTPAHWIRPSKPPGGVMMFGSVFRRFSSLGVGTNSIPGRLSRLRSRATYTSPDHSNGWEYGHTRRTERKSPRIPRR
ncbi:hypothetical protein C8R46DRAFT_142319 [Mycena filopes]|nr:hypothetical protein C8R46DRAFT_142319 [Mycena filopes]